MKHDYIILDVFTDRPLSGNPLGVVMNAEGLSDARMQAIASELNLPRTVFMRQPRTDYHTAALRIFTPREELPFAGHPTVGTAILLCLRQRLQGVRLEEKVGSITCVMERLDKNVASAQISLPQLPVATGPAGPVDAIADKLGIDPSEIGCGPFQPARYSAGVDFYLVPVRDAEVLGRLRIERRGWHSVFPEEQGAVFVFTATPDEPDNDFAARMFAPSMGIAEDPASGAAVAALIGLLASQEPKKTGQINYKLRQGQEMGRRSLISLRFTLVEGKLIRAGIGGSGVIVGEGFLNCD